jgi:DNA-binding winged helix-turn-helix (wHTH) protein
MPEFLFGSFRLIPSQHLLLESDKQVALGSRAMDILIALVERAGELVTKEELIARVWPKIFVEPANLTVHISGLRRALQDRCNGNRFIINIPGRGYRFVAPIILRELSDSSFVDSKLMQKPGVGNLPPNIAHLETFASAALPPGSKTVQAQHCSIRYGEHNGHQHRNPVMHKAGY